MNLSEAVRAGTEYLGRAGVADAQTDARLLLEWTMGITRTEYALDPLRVMEAEKEQVYLEYIRKRGRRIPLQHLTGEQEFMGLSFHVSPDVLIPRQDTELLAEEALKALKPGMDVLDLCTGSGCILISLERLGKERKAADETNTFIGSDVSRAALEVAERNKARHQADVSFAESDLFENLEGRYDMILSNPPYIRTDVIGELEEEVRRYDPILALDGREDGLYFYREIICRAKAHLKNGGLLFFEIGYDQREAVTDLMRKNGYREIHAGKDLAGLDRIVTGRYDIS